MSEMKKMKEVGHAWALKLKWVNRKIKIERKHICFAGRYWGGGGVVGLPIGLTGEAVRSLLIPTRRQARELAKKTNSHYFKVTPIKIKYTIEEVDG